jgi:ribosomal protein S18 acetylase RimI-like enzyme
MAADEFVVLQPAKPDNADLVPELIYATDPPIFSFLAGGRMDAFDRWIGAGWSAPDNDFSHEFAVVAVRDGELLGLELGYRGSEKKRLGRNNGTLTREALDQEALAHLGRAVSQGTRYFTPFVPYDAYYLMFLSVAEAGRNQGIGGRLLENAFQQARDGGLSSVHLDVYEGNPAIRLYERAGMEILTETRVPRLERDQRIPPHYRMVIEF